MAMTFQITDNSAELEKLLHENFQTAFEEIGQTAEAYAKEMCPVDTGRLRNSIGHQASEREVVVGTNVEYAPAVELGTSRREPKAFLRPSIENYIDKYKTIILNELKRM